MSENLRMIILGLPEDFDFTIAQAHGLDVDEIIIDASFEHGVWGAIAALSAARDAAHKNEEQVKVQALQLLIIIAGMGLSDDARAPFGRYMSGFDGAGIPWHTPLPADLTHQHLNALSVFLEVVTTPVLQARIADILWFRLTPRNPEHARIAIYAYLGLAKEAFSPSHWLNSELYFARAFKIAAQLGRQRAEFADVIDMAWAFLNKLDGNDPLYFTERIVSRIIATLSAEQGLELFDRVKAIADSSLASLDFERARVHYDLAILLARMLERRDTVEDLRRVRSETFATQALCAPTETQRSMYLRVARQELLNAGASRDRIAEISALLDGAQVLSISEMVSIGINVDLGQLPDHVRNLLKGRTPIDALWLFAGVSVIQSRQRVRELAEENVSKFPFAFGFGRRHLSRDGRQQGETPGAVGGSELEREAAIVGAMRDHAAHARMYAVLGAVEPGRNQLVGDHELSVTEIFDALQSRPFVPQGHRLLWAKAIHAGLVGEYDIAVHILAPQLENALREALRRQGEIVYSTRDGVQNLISIENILDHPKFSEIFGDDLVFTLDTALAGRLGANLRNHVAHGLVDDASSCSYDSAFVWWLTLRLIRGYGPDPLVAMPIA